MRSFAVFSFYYRWRKQTVIKISALRANLELFKKPNYILEVWVPKQKQ